MLSFSPVIENIKVNQVVAFMGLIDPFEVAQLANGLSPYETVLLYRGLGVAVVPIASGDKRPTRRGWTLRSGELSDFHQGDEIGIMCGQLSQSLVCVDLDGPLALALADQYLPPTEWIEGRAGKPSAHRFYLAPGVPPEWRSTAAGDIGGPPLLHYSEAKIDFIGTGGHVVGPPSLHPSGEVRRWEAFGQLREISFMELLNAVNALAVACGDRPKLARTSAGNSNTPPVEGGPQRSSDEPRRYHANLPPMDARVERARAYIDHVEGAVSGDGGSDATFRVARICLVDFALDEGNARQLLEEFNGRCDPEWSAHEIEHKLADADVYDGLRGAKLLPNVAKGGTGAVSLAEAFLAGRVHPLRWYRGQWYSYLGTHYRVVDDGVFSAWISAFLSERKLGCRRLIADVVSVLEGKCLVASEYEMPCLLSSGEQRHYIACLNGLFDVGAMLRGDTSSLLQVHSPNWFSTTCASYPYLWNAQCPAWMVAVQRLTCNEQDAMDLLAEWFGYCIIRNTDFHKFLLLFGLGANGKSTLLAVLIALLGEENVSHVALEDFGSRFQLGAMIGKLANICPEIGEVDKVAEGRLKALVSGDRLDVDRKFLPSIAVRPTARLVFATNTLPKFSDRSNGIWRRLLLLHLRGAIPESAQIQGLDKPETWIQGGEMPGIFCWAVCGLLRLMRNTAFTRPRSMEANICDYRQDSNPARHFILTHCRVAECASTAKHMIYQGYRTYCEENGHRYLASNSFGRELSASLRREIATTKVTISGRRVDGYASVEYHANGLPESGPV